MPFRQRPAQFTSDEELRRHEERHLAELEAERRARGRAGLFDENLRGRIERQKDALYRLGR